MKVLVLCLGVFADRGAGVVWGGREGQVGELVCAECGLRLFPWVRLCVFAVPRVEEGDLVLLLDLLAAGFLG